LAGPVVAAAVIIPEGVRFSGITDSKKMTARARSEAFDAIMGDALTFGIGVVSVSYIEKFNILNASLEAMLRAIRALDPQPEMVLVDGIHAVPTPIKQKCLKKAINAPEAFRRLPCWPRCIGIGLWFPIIVNIPNTALIKTRGMEPGRTLRP
jgi:ribonuclease HII